MDTQKDEDREVIREEVKKFGKPWMEEEKKEDNQERKDGKKEEGRNLDFRIK